MKRLHTCTLAVVAKRVVVRGTVVFFGLSLLRILLCLVPTRVRTRVPGVHAGEDGGGDPRTRSGGWWCGDVLAAPHSSDFRPPTMPR